LPQPSSAYDYSPIQFIDGPFLFQPVFWQPLRW
jgi:hypothetical protein